MKQKRICIDINSIVPLFVRGYVSGVGRTTLELVEALADVKEDLPFEIVLYSQNMKGIGGRNLNLPFKNKHLYFPHRENYDKFLGKYPIREIFTRYDLLHIPHNFEYVYCPEKIIVTLHDALFMKFQEKFFNHERMKLEVPPLMHKCKAIITCSKSSKEDIVETMNVDPEKIHVIPWGIRHDIFFPEYDSEILERKFGLKKAYFFSIPCSDERKNTPMLIDAYIELCKNNPENDLCLIWDAPQYIREKINYLGVQNRIHLLKNIDNNDLRVLYSGATATVFPSMYEGFGLPVLESMACGTPVITSNTSSLPEVGGNAAIYIDPADKLSILNAMMLFENNVVDKAALSEKGVEHAFTYTWDKCARATLGVYQKYLND